ncbi:MAG: DUF1648 domain-containing protein [Rhodoglobus sp.]
MTIKTRMIIVGVIAPLVIGAAGIIAILLALPRLPDPIATHWGPSGQPDDFASPVSSMVFIAALIVGYSALSFALARLIRGSNATQRMILAMAPAIATLIAVSGAGSALSQQGLRDGHDAPSIFPTLLLALGLAIVAGVGGWFALPAAAAVVPAAHADLPVMNLGAQERAAWLQRIEPSRAVGTFAIGGLAVVIVGGGVLMGLTAPTGIFVAWVTGMVLIGVVVVSALFWTVRIDAKGMEVRSVLGVPRFIIPSADVDSATPTDVVALRDFGGYGIRGFGKRVGVILRSGEAIEVTRKDGRVFIVTVPQSRQGAALLNAVAARA